MAVCVVSTPNGHRIVDRTVHPPKKARYEVGIKARLKVVADFAGDKERMADQLEYVGEAIESEFQKIESRIKGIEKDVLGSLRKHWKRLYLIEHRIEALESVIKTEASLAENKTIELKEPVPTDKDEPKFQVGDTIALKDRGDIRIVLEVKSDSRLRVMSVPNGYIQENCLPNQYTLVYRPGSPKPEPTVKEEIVTDKDDKPPGGLEPGDVISFRSPDDIKHRRSKRYGIYDHNLHSWEIYAYMLNPGSVDLESLYQDFITFEFRPKLPEEA